MIKLKPLSNGSYCAINSYIANNNEFISLDIIKSDGKINRLELTNEGNVLNHINYDGSKWIRIGRFCTTNVANVAPTTITFTSTKNYTPSSNIPLKYTIMNGICYVSGGIYCVSPSSSETLVYTLPKPKAEWQYCKTIGVIKNLDDTNTVLMIIWKNGELNLTKGVAGGEYRCTFSYPVADNSTILH